MTHEVFRVRRVGRRQYRRAGLLDSRRTAVVDVGRSMPTNPEITVIGVLSREEISTMRLRVFQPDEVLRGTWTVFRRLEKSLH